MKPCLKNRKLITWLALEELDAQRAGALRAHLRICEGCRRYLAEISSTAEKLSVPEASPEIQASKAFHQRVVDALRAHEAESGWATLVAPFRWGLLNWRVALPVLGASAVVMMALALLNRPTELPSLASRGSQPASVRPLSSELAPTLSNYQIVAKQSLERLDELLTRQADRNLSPTSIYTASTLTREVAPD